MGLRYRNLDALTRSYMIAEVERDMNGDSLYLSSRLNLIGRNQYPALLYKAVLHHDDDWLSGELARQGCFAATEVRQRKGKQFEAKVPVNASLVLSEGEFNRFYLRGLCRRAMADGIERLEVYRGKEVSNPRSASIDMIGKRIRASELLEDLRSHTGVDTALGLPPGPNSGLTAKFT